MTDVIQVLKKGIYGVKNPKLTLVIYSTDRFPVFRLYAGEKAVPFVIYRIDKKNHFVMEAEINVPCQKVILKYLHGNEEVEISEINNFLIMRVLSRSWDIIFTLIKKTARKIGNIVKRGCSFAKFLWQEYHFNISISTAKKHFNELLFSRYEGNKNDFYNPGLQYDYLKWIRENDNKRDYSVFEYNPLISIVIPVYNIEVKYLKDCISSILSQSYQNFEICIADDCSSKSETIAFLKKLESTDNRIKIVYRNENGNISEATNSALAIASGEYVGFMDDDDMLHQDALYEVVSVLNKERDIDFIYTDEDKLDENGKRCDPHFKPDYSKDTFLSVNYISHFSVIKKCLLDKTGGLRSEFNGAQDYDLYLRVLDFTDKVFHISKILYHWRKIPGSTASTIDSKSYAVEKGRLAIQDKLDRNRIKARARIHNLVPMYYVDYLLPTEPSVSIIIPTKDLAETLDECLKSIFDKTDYANYEVVVVDNNSCEQNTFLLFDKYKNTRNNFRIVKAEMEFNYSRINNLAIRTCETDYIVLLNNDTKVMDGDWLRKMISYASQEHIGAVGVKLLYPDYTIQHCGVIAGLGGVASHVGVYMNKDSNALFGRLLLTYNYSSVTAACLAVNRKKFDLVGGLSEELEVSYNDIDFCFKLLKKGYSNVCVPQVTLFHFESKTRGIPKDGKKYEQFVNEQKIMYKKWPDIIDYDPFYNANFSKLKPFYLDSARGRAV